MTSIQFYTAIFDLDGTLVDSLVDIAEASNRALGELGFPSHETDRYRFFVGDGLMTLARRIVPRNTPEKLVTETARLFKRHYAGGWQRTTRLYPGIMAMLTRLLEDGVNLAVLSNKPDDFTRLFVSTFFPAEMFGLVFGHRDQVPKKPDPQGALEIADYFGTAPQACLFIGDTSVDIATGKAAGMTSMGVTWGFRKRQELENAGADLIIDRPYEIISHVIHPY
jgi:phosphoglycolate phosphatase